MNDNTAKILEKLASQLGTTSQYLWSILLKQAPIDGCIMLFQYMLLIIAGIVLYRVNKNLSKKDEKGYNDGYDNNDAYGVIMCIAVFAWTITAIIAFCCIGGLFNAFFNPEYWALETILSKINGN